MIEVADAQRYVADEIRDPRHPLVIDVLRLVCDLVIVRVSAGREERDRNAVAGILVVVTATVDVRRMPVGVDRIVENEPGLPIRVDLLDDVTELLLEPARADEL